MHTDIAPLCSGLPRVHTRTHTCTAWTVRAVGTYVRVLAYLQIRGTRWCVLRHEPLKQATMHKAHARSCTCIGTTLHMKTLSHSPPSIPQETLDIRSGHTLAILKLGSWRQENQEFQVALTVNSKPAWLQETLSQNTGGQRCSSECLPSVHKVLGSSSSAPCNWI